MTLLKKLLFLIVTTTLLLAKLLPVSAQFAYKSSVHVTFGKVSFDLYCKTGTFGYGQQFYPANFYNETFYDIHVKGEYVATLTCGNETVSKLNFTCKKYSSIIHVDVNAPYFPYANPEGFGSDISGLVGIADEKLCPGNEVVVQNWSDGTKVKTKDRISALNIRNLKLFAIQDDGSEVPITDEGVMISSPAGTHSNEAQGTVGNKPNTAVRDSSKYPSNALPGASPVAATTTITQPKNAAQNQQQQQYQQQANNYLNAANHSSDAIQQSMNTNLAAINATAAGNTAQANQIRQMQQQQTAENNAAVAQSLNDLGSAVGNLLANSQRKKDQERQRQADHQAYEQERKQQEEAEKQREDNMRIEEERARQTELNNQHTIDQQALGAYITRKKTSEIPENSKEIFFITYERTHETFYSVKIKTYSLAKYSDGTWMMLNDVMKKAKFDEVFNYDSTRLLVGFFTSKQDALNLIENMKAFFQGRITTDTSFLAINQPAGVATKKDDFWNQ